MSHLTPPSLEPGSSHVMNLANNPQYQRFSEMSRGEDYFGYFEDVDENSVMRDIKSVVLLEAHDAIAASLFVSALASMIGAFPGHHDGGVWPLYVPEAQGHRTSQHLFDPYSFAHVNQGIISYYIFDYWYYDEDSSSRNSNVGLVKAIFAGVAWELVENTEVVVDLFRNNSGTSDVYRGDSSINVYGDLLSCAIGYNFARSVSEHFSPVIPLIIFTILEITMMVAFRDNMLLMFIQLLSPITEIKEWQNESPLAHFFLQMQGKDADAANDPHVGYWSTKYTSELFAKYKPPRIAQSLLNPQVHYMRMMP